MIEEALKKYGIVDDKFYRLAMLHSVLTELGIINMQRESFTSVWFRRRIEKGSLIFPDKSNKTDRWLLTGKQIRSIVKAFVPGGKGHYDYREDNNDA